MTIKSKAFKVLSWALCATLVSAIAWAAVGWRVDSYGNILSGRSSVILAPGQTSNCRLTYSGSTLSVVGADGNALDPTNPCEAQLNAATTLSFTAAVSSTFGAASDTDGNVFGLTAGVAHANPLPFFIQACQGSASNYFAFSRNNARIETGNAAGDMAQEDDTDGDGQNDLFIMSSGLTLANEVDRPCVTVGSFEATMDSSNQWTVSTLVADRDGFGFFQRGVEFLPSAGQYGNQSAKYHNVADGATNLVFANQNLYYTVEPGGYYTYHVRLTNASANGADATALKLFMPAASVGTSTRVYSSIVRYYTSGATIGMLENTAGDGFAYLYTTAAGTVNDNAFSGGASSYIVGMLRYQAFLPN